jgi:hypothetical protein
MNKIKITFLFGANLPKLFTFNTAERAELYFVLFKWSKIIVPRRNYLFCNKQSSVVHITQFGKQKNIYPFSEPIFFSFFGDATSTKSLIDSTFQSEGQSFYTVS